MLGPMGTFRFFGNGANDFWTLTNTFAWTDNLSLVHGRHNARVGGVFLVQYNDRLDTGAARGKITFETFEDLLVGLSAADNQSPGGRSNIETVRANEGVGPNGEVQYQYRHYYGAGFAQDDFKVTPRLALNAGLRWEYVGPSFDKAGTIGNVWPSLLKQAPIPPLSGTLAGDVVAANYNPALINPYTGQPFGPPPTGVWTGATRSFYQNNTPLGEVRSPAGFCVAAVRSRRARRGARRVRLVLPGADLSAPTPQVLLCSPRRRLRRDSPTPTRAMAQSNLEKPFPTTTLGFVPRTPTSQLSDRIAGPEYKIPAAPAMEPERSDQAAQSFHSRHRLCRVVRRQPVGRRGPQPAAARQRQPTRSNCGYTGVPADCITTNTAVNAELRVPFMGETPSALTDSEFTGESLVSRPASDSPPADVSRPDFSIRLYSVEGDERHFHL